MINKINIKQIVISPDCHSYLHKCFFEFEREHNGNAMGLCHSYKHQLYVTAEKS